MNKRSLLLLVLAPVLLGCAYSTKSPIAAPAGFIRPVGPDHNFRQSIRVEDVRGVSENARHIGIFKIVSEKEVNAALRKNLQTHGLAAASKEAARYTLRADFTDISASLKFGRSQPATAVLNYDLTDNQSQTLVKHGRIEGKGNARGVGDASVRTVESARCAVRNTLYKLALTLRSDQPLPQSGFLDGGCQFTTRYR